MEESCFLAYSPRLAQFAFLYIPDHLPRSDSTHIHPDSSSSIINQELLYRSAYRPICWGYFLRWGTLFSDDYRLWLMQSSLDRPRPRPFSFSRCTQCHLSKHLLSTLSQQGPSTMALSQKWFSPKHLEKFFLPGIPSAQEIFRQFWFILVYKIHIQSQYLLIISQKRNVFQNNGERQGCSWKAEFLPNMHNTLVLILRNGKSL